MTIYLTYIVNCIAKLKLHSQISFISRLRNAMPHLLDKLLHTLVKSLHQIMFIKLNYSCGLILRHCPFLLAHFLFILDSVVYRWRSRSCYVEQEMCYVVARHERW